MAAADHALVKAVLSRIARDEAHHPKLGALVLEWAEPVVKRHTAHLRSLALDTIEAYAPLWQAQSCGACQLAPTYGGIPNEEYRALLRNSVARRIVAPLARLGLDLRGDRLEAMLANKGSVTSV